uniref:LOB domain-containing protein n=1 Tax=Aegilops tauschii subsp. strangulata TaxID=200361 RepID=A0A453FU80_AEGTS
RCAHECPFAPYFSPHEPHKFAAVHKVFGASNVSKMLLEVPEAERADAASSLVYEANLRLRDPVYGCMGAISMLQQQVNALEAELQAVRAEIFKHRSEHDA